MTPVAYLKPPPGHEHVLFQCCAACHQPLEEGDGLRHCVFCCRNIEVDAEGLLLPHAGVGDYHKHCLGARFELPSNLSYAWGSGRSLSIDQVTKAIDLTLEYRHPLDLKRREVVFVVIHWRPGPVEEGWTHCTFVEATAYSLRGPDARRRSSRYRFCARAGAVLGELPDVPEHPRGICGPCTLRWRYYNGLGLAIDDVADLPGYLPDAQMPEYGTLTGLPEPPATAETVDELFASVAKNTVTRRGRKVRRVAKAVPS